MGKLGIFIQKIIKGIQNKSFEIFKSQNGFCFPKCDYFYIAIDDSGKVFPLHNFWTDDFERFIKVKYGKIENIEKAIEVIRIYTETKFKDIGIIIDNGIIDSIKNWYPQLQKIDGLDTLKCIQNKNDFEINTYIYFPYWGVLKFFNFNLNEDAEINFKEKIIYENK